MVLNQEQKQSIEYYLNSKELIHLDLRDEVADHMMSAIENSMIHGISFEVAFEEEAQKWKNDLSGYSSYWLGLFWAGPRIVIEKCVKKIKRIYLNAISFALVITSIVFLSKDYILSYSLSILDFCIGFIYLGFFSYLLYLKYRIKSTGNKTSYSFSFNIHAISMSMILTLYNPLFTSILDLTKDNAINFLSVLVHSFTIGFSYFFKEMYSAHMNFQKLKTV